MPASRPVLDTLARVLHLDDDQQKELFPRVLGEDTYADMTADGSGLAWDHVQLAATTTMIWIVSSSLAHTRISFPSLVMVIPRGRCPTGTVFTVFI